MWNKSLYSFNWQAVMVLKHGRSVWLSVAGDCEEHCSHCYLGFDEQARPQRVDGSQLIIDGLLATARSWSGPDGPLLVFFGGDPLADPELIAGILRRAEVRLPSPRVIIYTSGRGLTGPLLTATSQHRVKFVLSRPVRRPPAEERLWLRGLFGEMRELGLKFAIHGTVTPGSDLPGFLDHFADLPRPDVTTMWVEWVPAVREGASSASIGIERAVQQMLQRGTQATNWINATNLYRQLYYSSRYRIPCEAGREMIATDGTGGMFPCFRFLGRQSYRIGSVTGGIDVEACRLFRERTARAVSEFCGTCPIWGLCPGRCPFSLLESEPSRADFFCACQKRLVRSVSSAWDRLSRSEPETMVRLGDIAYAALVEELDRTHNHTRREGLS